MVGLNGVDGVVGLDWVIGLDGVVWVVRVQSRKCHLMMEEEEMTK